MNGKLIQPTDPLPAIEVSEQGANRTLKIGDLTITIDRSNPEDLEFPVGITFHFDAFLVSLIQVFDKAGNELARDALLQFRFTLSNHPELVGFFQKLAANSVRLDNTNYIRFERKQWDKFMKTVNAADVPRSVPQSSGLYVGDDDE